jgi:hypothetical protein
MNIIKRILRFSLDDAIESLVRRRCPSCGRKGLQGGPNPAEKPVLTPHGVVRTYPECLWFRCVYCGARFKMGHDIDAKLEIPTEEEWPSDPKPGEGNKA